MIYTIEEGHQFVDFWKITVEDGFTVNENAPATYFRLVRDGIELIYTDVKSEILDIARLAPHTLEVTVRIDPLYFVAGTQCEYELVIKDLEDKVLLEDSGSIYAVDQEVEPLPLDVQTTTNPWHRNVLAVEFVDDNVSSGRLVICETCPFYQDNTCLQCGCWMPSKVTQLDATCPVGYW